MENFILLRMPICGIYAYISVYICAVHSKPWSAGKILWTQLRKGNGCLKKQAMEVARLVNEENDCTFEVQMEEHWVHTRPTWSIAVRERLLELFCD